MVDTIVICKLFSENLFLNWWHWNCYKSNFIYISIKGHGHNLSGQFSYSFNFNADNALLGYKIPISYPNRDFFIM